MRPLTEPFLVSDSQSFYCNWKNFTGAASDDFTKAQGKLENFFASP
jgi:hypothetical protein